MTYSNHFVLFDYYMSYDIYKIALNYHDWLIAGAKKYFTIA